MEVVGPTSASRSECEPILRSLPEWFGIPSAIRNYLDEIQMLHAFVAKIEGQTVGFITLRHHFPTSAEVHLIAVHRDYRRAGIGTSLLDASEAWLQTMGAVLLQVKTLSPTRVDQHYEQTRAFYSKHGFKPLEELPQLWGDANPCLLMVKCLLHNGTR